MKKPNISREALAEKRGFLHDFLRVRQHPIKILGYTSKTLWLMVIPIVKNILTSEFDIQGWIRTYWLDFIFIAAILGVAVFRWLFVFYKIEDDGISSHFGPLGIMRSKVYFSEITSFSTNQGYLYRAVNACAMYIETNADSFPKTDLKLVLSEKSVEEIYRVMTEQSMDAPSFSVQARRRDLLIFSLLFSSTVSGIILFATFTYEVYRLVGQELEKRLFVTVNGELTRIDDKLLGISRAVPKAILMIGSVIAGGWLISFLTNLMAHWNFTATRRGSQLLISSGIVTRRRSVLNRQKLNYFDITQTLSMKLAGISSVNIFCTGYGARRGESSALIPITTNRAMTASLHLLEPTLTSHRTQVHTGKGDLARFTVLPILTCFLPICAGSGAKLLIDRWHSEINILMFVLTLPLIWLVVVGAAASRTTAAGITSSTCTLCYWKLYKFHRIIMPRENISKLSVTQNIFQKLGGTCTLRVYTNSERRKVHRISRLRFEEVKKLCAEQVCAEMM